MHLKSMFREKIRKIAFFHIEIIFFTAVKNCSSLHGRVLVMTSNFMGLQSSI